MNKGERKHHPSLLTVRAPRKTAQGCRIRQLYRSFIVKLNRNNAEHQAMALTASELTVTAEDARARLLAGDQSKEANDAVVRLENTARRARLDLTRKPKRMTAAEKRRQWLAQQGGNDGEESEG